MASSLSISRRSTGFVDVLRRYRIYVNDEYRGRLGRRDTFRCAVTPGNLRVQVRIDWTGSPVWSRVVADGENVKLDVAHGPLPLGVVSTSRYLKLTEIS